MRSLLVASIVVLCVSHASAQTAQPTDQDRAAALAMLQAGIQSAEDGDWESARVAFTRAYTLVASTRVLMNLAGAQRHTGRLRDARESYRRWLIDATDRDEAYRPTVTQALGELESEIPRVTVSLAGASNGDVVQIDGGEIEIGASVELDLGPHTAEVVRGASVIASESFSLALGERRDVELVVPSLEPAAVAIVAAPHVSLITQREHDDPFASPWVWVGIGAGVAVVLVVIIAVAVATSSSSTPAPDMGTLGPFHL
jgi:hypothetical protein